MNSISTKTGDSGKTSLANGERLSKTDLTFEIIGDLDELSSHLGLVLAMDPHLAELKQAQHDLYIISAQLVKAKKVKLEESALKDLEKVAEDLQQSMKDGWHSKFLYPGGTVLGAQLDIARSVCRRVERHYFKFLANQDADKKAAVSLELIARYLNRLSDYLYLLRCAVNQEANHREQELVK